MLRVVVFVDKRKELPVTVFYARNHRYSADIGMRNINPVTPQVRYAPQSSVPVEQTCDTHRLQNFIPRGSLSQTPPSVYRRLEPTVRTLTPGDFAAICSPQRHPSFTGGIRELK